MTDKLPTQPVDAQPDAPRPKPGLDSNGGSSAGGLASGLQSGGTTPGSGPGASIGSIGTGGGSNANQPSGDVKKTGR